MKKKSHKIRTFAKMKKWLLIFFGVLFLGLNSLEAETAFLDVRVEVAAKGGMKLLGQPINQTAKGLAHVLDRHTINGIAKYAGKSKFANPSEVSSLIQQVTHHPMILQANGNYARIINAGRNIGTNMVTGQPTSIYTVITRANGNLVTAFPGRPF